MAVSDSDSFCFHNNENMPTVLHLFIKNISVYETFENGNSNNSTLILCHQAIRSAIFYAKTLASKVCSSLPVYN